MSRLGLALGGGATRGAAHVGILKALEDHRLIPDCLAGTSIGSLIGALYAFNRSTSDIQRVVSALTLHKVSNLKFSRLGFLTNEEIGRLVEQEIGNVNLEDAPIPLSIVATDIASGKKIILRRGSVSRAVMASSCIPGLFSPVSIDGLLLVDGVLSENVPISPLQLMKADVIIASTLSANRVYRTPDDVVDILVNAFDMMVDRTIHSQLQGADVLIEPSVWSTSRKDKNHIEILIQEGYQATEAQIQTIRLLVQRSAAHGLPKAILDLRLRLRNMFHSRRQR